jgi:hypothetical protein
MPRRGWFEREERDPLGPFAHDFEPVGVFAAPDRAKLAIS